MVCPYCRLLAPIQSGLFELRLDPYRKDRSRYVHRICKKPGKPPTVVPARFLVACEHGHLDDFPWVEFVHRGRTDCRYELRLYELGASGEVADIQVQCVKCEGKRRLSDAFSDEGREELRQCKGRWPHLRKYDEDACEGRQRAILLGASNSWFPIMLSVLSIPTTTDKLGQLVEMNWAELEECESARDVKLKRKLLKGLAAFGEDPIWEAVVKRKEASGQEEDEFPDLREPEWKVFSDPDPSLHSRDFKLRVVDPPRAYRKVFEKVVLAERLREVRALTGFTRIESPGDYTEVGEFPPEQRVPLGRKPPKWVPTSEIRGEGVFLQFAEEAIEAWVKRTREREGEFFEAHQAVAEEPGPGARRRLPDDAVRAAALAGPRPDPPVRHRVRLHDGEHPGADLLPPSGGRPRADGGRPALHRRPRQRGDARRASSPWATRRRWAGTWTRRWKGCGSAPPTRSAPSTTRSRTA